jgi:hypothetical protein
MTAVLPFLYGATAMACLVAALFFLRYWRASRDRLFLLFAVAFLALAANRIAIATVHVAAENVPYLYLLRLLAFALIAFAVVDKNRARP